MNNTRLLELVSQSQPHQVLAFLLGHVGMEPDEIDKRHAGTPLELLLDVTEASYQQHDQQSKDPLCSWFEPLRTNMPRKFGELVKNTDFRRTYAAIIDAVVGVTKFQQYYRHSPAKDIAEWIETIDDLLLIEGWARGDQDAFTELYHRHSPVLNGFIRLWGRRDQDVKDIAQKTWDKVLKKLWIEDPENKEAPKKILFDPSRGNFQAVLKYWAKLQLLQGTGEGPEQPPEPPPPARPTIAAEEFDKFMRVTFGGKSAPHHLIVFGFAKLLQWKPSEVVEELSDITFHALVIRLETELIEILPARVDLVHGIFTNLREIMENHVRFRDAPMDPKSKALYPHLMDRIVAGTTLRNYYFADPTAPDYFEQCSADIVQWWNTVKKRVVTELEE